MSAPVLEVTYTKGKPMAAYVRLLAVPVTATRKLAPSLIGDFDETGTLRGVEVLSFEPATLDCLNEELERHGYPRLRDAELGPLRAA